MNIEFTGRNIEVTPALKNFTTEKLQKLEQRFNHIKTIHVTFHIENINHIAEATLHVYGVDLHATAKSEDMYTAVDELMDRLAAQLSKHKDKITDHR